MASISQIAGQFTSGSINRPHLACGRVRDGPGNLRQGPGYVQGNRRRLVFGRSDAMDAFLAAALIPSLLINLISESMNQALVPTLVRVREQEGRERAQQLLSNSMLWMCVLLGAASALMALLARAFFPLIASHFEPAKLALPLSLLCASPGGSHYRNCHQLHRGSEHC